MYTEYKVSASLTVMPLRVSHGNAFEFRFNKHRAPPGSIVPDVCKKAFVNVHFTAESVVNRKICVAAFIGSARHRQIQIALHRERIISRETAAEIWISEL